MFPQGAPCWVDALDLLWTPGIWVFVCALVLTLLGTPLFRWIAVRKGITDKPDDAVKIHKTPIPYLGGAALWLAWTVSLLLYFCFRGTGMAKAEIALCVGGAIAFVTGLLDDLLDLPPRTKLLGQMLAGGALLAGGVQWLAFPALPYLPFLDFGSDSWFVWGVCLVVHFAVVVGATNATNLMDGLDGLCSGVAAIVSVGFLLLATSLAAYGNNEWNADAIVYEYAPLIMTCAFALAGVTIGFLPYNFNPARIFMGDAGSVFIGYVIAAMMIMFSNHFGFVKWFVGSLFIFGVPIFDTALAVVRRLLNRRPIMAADRSHLYNQLVDRLGLSVPVTVGLFFAMSVLFGAAGLLMLYIPGRIAILVYLAIAAIFMLLVWRLGFLHLTPEEKAAADRFLKSHEARFGRDKR